MNRYFSDDFGLIKSNYKINFDNIDLDEIIEGSKDPRLTQMIISSIRRQKPLIVNGEVKNIKTVYIN